MDVTGRIWEKKSREIFNQGGKEPDICRYLLKGELMAV